jgi:hypothetical protein
LLIHIAVGLLFVLDRSPGTDAALSGFPLDDTWIHMVYAQNLAQYGLPYYNPGVLEAGFTSPLWMVFGAIAHIISSTIGVSVVPLIKILGILLAWLTSVAIFEICRRFTNYWVSSLLGALYLATLPIMAFSQVSGMEVCLAACMSTWAILVLLKGRFLLGGVLLGLATMARPEHTILTALVVLMFILSRSPKSYRRKLNRISKILLPTLVLLLLWSLLCLGINGHLMPNTYYAKSSTHQVVEAFGRIIGEVVLGMPVMFLFSGILLYLAGILYMLRSRHRPIALTLIFYPWLFMFGIAASRDMPYACGQYFYWLRYVVPGLPFLFVVISAGFEFLWRAAKETLGAGSKNKVAWLVHAAIVLLVIVTWMKLPGQLRFRSSQFAWNCQNMNEVQVELGKWVNDNTPPDAVIAVNDAGALSYFGKRKTIDLVGLNNLAILFNPQLAAELRIELSTMIEFMKSESSRYLIIIPSWFPLTRSPQFEDYFRMVEYRKSENYTICGAPQDLMAVYIFR